MKHLLIVVLASALITGCSDSTAPKEEKGTITFQVDAQTCTGSGTMTYFIDGKNVGSQTVVPGTSKSFEATVGYHTIGASTSTLTWPSQDVYVYPNEARPWIMTC